MMNLFSLFVVIVLFFKRALRVYIFPSFESHGLNLKMSLDLKTSLLKIRQIVHFRVRYDRSIKKVKTHFLQP